MAFFRDSDFRSSVCYEPKAEYSGVSPVFSETLFGTALSMPCSRSYDRFQRGLGSWSAITSFPLVLSGILYPSEHVIIAVQSYYVSSRTPFGHPLVFHQKMRAIGSSTNTVVLTATRRQPLILINKLEKN